MQRSYRFAIESPSKSGCWVRDFLADAAKAGIDVDDIASSRRLLEKADYMREENVIRDFATIKRKASLLLLPLPDIKDHDPWKFGTHAALCMMELCNNPNAYVVHDFGDIPQAAHLHEYRPHIEAYSVLRLYCDRIGPNRVLNRQEALRKLSEMAKPAALAT